MMYLDWDTIRAARQELGLPTTSVELDKLETELLDRQSHLMETIFSISEKEWFNQNPGQLIPADVTISLHNKARRAAVNQIMEDEVNEPMRQLLIQQEEQEEQERQIALEAS